MNLIIWCTYHICWIDVLLISENTTIMHGKSHRKNKNESINFVRSEQESDEFREKILVRNASLQVKTLRVDSGEVFAKTNSNSKTVKYKINLTNWYSNYVFLSSTVRCIESEKDTSS